ncbi:TniQ family protein [Rhizobium sp. 21-4511-3d]
MSIGLYKLRFHDDETAAGFCSRLAAACGISSDAFCEDMGFRYHMILRADEKSLRLLSEVSSVPFEKLRHNAIRPLKQGQSMVRGELMRMPFFQTGTSRLCPHCINDDRKMRGPSPAYDRLAWHSRFIRTCHIHNTELFTGPGKIRDFTTLLEDQALAIHRAAHNPNKLAFSKFENFVLDRLNGIKGHSVLLDELSLNTGGDLAELIGAFTLFGKYTNLENLTTSQWHQAASAGFDFLLRGPSGLRDFAAQITADVDWTRFRGRGTRLFGGFYYRLQLRRKHIGYEKVCDALLQHVEDHFSVPTGIKIFGKEVRTKHDAIYRTDRFSGEHIDTVKAALSVVVGDDSRKRTVFSIETFEEAAQYLASLVTRGEAEALLAIHHDQFRQLLERGCIQPSESYGRARPAGNPRYSREEVLAFIRSLRIDQPVDLSDDMLPIMTAAISASVEFGDIVTLLQKRKLKKVHYDVSKTGLAQIYIAPSELREHGERPANWIDSEEAASRLGYDEQFFCLLVRAKLLTPQKFRVFGYRLGSNFFHVDEIDAFARSYTTARDVAAMFEIPFGTVRHMLRVRSVGHVMFEKRLVFVRSEAEAVGREIRQRLLGLAQS